jgi:hypothetical protein
MKLGSDESSWPLLTRGCLQYTEGIYIENNTWQNPYHMPYHPEKPTPSRGPLDPRDDIGRG